MEEFFKTTRCCPPLFSLLSCGFTQKRVERKTFFCTSAELQQRDRDGGGNPFIIYLLKANLLADSCDKTKRLKNNHGRTRRRAAGMCYQERTPQQPWDPSSFSPYQFISSSTKLLYRDILLVYFINEIDVMKHEDGEQRGRRRLSPRVAC